MNPELSSIIDQALQYASPLPVSQTQSVQSSVHDAVQTSTAVSAAGLSHTTMLQTVEVPMSVSGLHDNFHSEIGNSMNTFNDAIFTTANSSESLKEFPSTNSHDIETEFPDVGDCDSVPLLRDYLGDVVNVSEAGSGIAHVSEVTTLTTLSSNSSLVMSEEMVPPDSDISISSAALSQFPVYTTCTSFVPVEEVTEQIGTERSNDILRDFSLFCDKIQTGQSEPIADKQISIVNSSTESSTNDSSIHSILTPWSVADDKDISCSVSRVSLNSSSPCPSAPSSCPSASSSCPSASSSSQLTSESCSSVSVPQTNSVKPKRKRKREVIPDRIPSVTVLPPCRICDEKSSGYHYGANTCEACKGFFRRTLKKKEVNFACKCTDEEKGAWQRNPIKNGCPACRYERCLAVGMSKNAIKIGRYTLNRKTENIKEVKSLEAMDGNIESTPEGAPADTSPGSGGGTDISYLGLSSPEVTPVSVGELKAYEPCDNVQKTIESSSASDSSASATKRLSLKEIDTIVKDLMEAQTLIEDMTKEIDTIVKDLMEAQTLIEDMDTMNRIPQDQLQERQAKYLEVYNMKQAMFGTLGTLSREEYFGFYKATGIDVDGRKEKLDGAFQFFEKKIGVLVEFAKHIPGFRSLSLQDQASLMKASRCESILIGCQRFLYDQYQNVGTSPWGREFHVDEVGKILPIEMIQERKKYARRFIELKLTKQEEALVRAIIIMFADRCELEDPARVQSHQEVLMECLEHVLSLRPGGPGTLLYRIINFMMSIREHTNKDNDIIKKMVLSWPIAENFQLVKEFIG